MRHNRRPCKVNAHEDPVNRTHNRHPCKDQHLFFVVAKPQTYRHSDKGLHVDVLYFLRERTAFIKRFYEAGSQPFLATQKQIEGQEEPFNDPPPGHDLESGEPPFLEEWMDAGESLDLLGQMCLSMLSSSLELFLEEWLIQRGVRHPSKDPEARKESGWFNRYRWYFRERLGIDWEKGPAKTALLEQIVLARNNTQHPDDITTVRVGQTDFDVAKYPESFFADEMLVIRGEDGQPIIPVRLKVTGEKLTAALEAVDSFCAWIDEQ